MALDENTEWVWGVNLYFISKDKINAPGVRDIDFISLSKHKT